MKKVVLLLLAISISALIYLIIDENRTTNNEYITNFKTEHPDFKVIPDIKLAEGIHRTYYKDMGDDEYYTKIGLENPKQKQMIKQMLYIFIPFLFIILYLVIKKKDLLEKIGGIKSMNIKTILIGLFTLAFLFLLFLNSGGLYEYKSNSQGVPMFRVNKITNNIQSLDNKGWRDVLKEERD